MLPDLTAVADLLLARKEDFNTISAELFLFESVGYIKSVYRRCFFGSDSIYYPINNDILENMTIIGKQNLKNIL